MQMMTSSEFQLWLVKEPDPELVAKYIEQSDRWGDMSVKGVNELIKDVRNSGNRYLAKAAAKAKEVADKASGQPEEVS